MPSKAAAGKLQSYYRLTKPGIVYGNALPATAGFLLASKGHIHIGRFVIMLLGLSYIIAASCVINNYTDRDIDKRMERTKKRALAVGTISTRNALVFAIVLGVIGSLLLGVFINILSLLLALFCMFAYLVLYGIGKRKTVHGTLIGSISGAMPPVVGYVAVTNRIDTAALLLFAVLVTWQMPHFYAIAIFRAKDYKAADIPVLPVVKGVKTTKIQIIAYVIAFLISSSLLNVYGYTGYVYLAGTLIVGAIWLVRGLRGLRASDDIIWARQMFGFSLIVLLTWSALVSISPLLKY